METRNLCVRALTVPGWHDDHATSDILALTPRSRSPELSPARDSSQDFLKVSMSVTLVLTGTFDALPTISTSYPALEHRAPHGRMRRCHGRDGEDILNGHQEGLVEITLGGGDPSVDSLRSSSIFCSPISGRWPSRAQSAEPIITGVSSPSKP